MKKIIQILTIVSMILAWNSQSLAQIMGGPQTAQKVQQGRQAIGASDWLKADAIIKELRAGNRDREANTLAQEVQRAQARTAPTAPALPVGVILPGDLQNLLNLVGGGVNSIAGVNGVIRNIIRLIDPTTRGASLYDTADIIRALFNFLGGQPDGVTSVVDAIQKLDQWTGNPMAGYYNATAHLTTSQAGINFDPATQIFDLKAIIVPRWNEIQPLLLGRGDAGAITALNNLGSLLDKISPISTAAIDFDHFTTPLYHILMICGTAGAAGSPARNLRVASDTIEVILKLGGATQGTAISAARDLSEVADNLLLLVNNLEIDLAPRGAPRWVDYTAATVPAVDIGALSNRLTAQTYQKIGPALTAFLTDAAGAPIDQTEAIKKIVAFQAAINPVFPNAADNLDELLNHIVQSAKDAAEKDTFVDNAQKRLARDGGYENARVKQVWIANNSAVVQQILDDIVNL